METAGGVRIDEGSQRSSSIVLVLFLCVGVAACGGGRRRRAARGAHAWLMVVRYEIQNRNRLLDLAGRNSK
jgi:hypothetical protein